MKSLSEEQCKAIEQRGKFVLLACPGSGKTFTVAHRLAKRLKEWKSLRSGIATLSFTNVAHEEIGQQLQQLGCPAVPPYPHFLGTIDHFINTWIFLPFGHLVMECDERPDIVGFQESIWNPSGKEWSRKEHECYKCDLLKFTFGLNGELLYLDPKKKLENCPHQLRECKRLKEMFRKRGYATQADANYWAMKILETYPRVAKTLARRFPEMIVDEAQDTSDTQMRILDLLVEHGLSEVMLVGDPDQAIYEWRDAKPEVFMSKASAEGWGKALNLTKNRRSSQHICNATKGFSRYLREPSTAAGDDASCEIRPKIIEYDPEKFDSLTKTFITICHDNRIIPSSESTAILVRTNRILRKILGIKHKDIKPWDQGKQNREMTRLLARGAYYYHEKQNPRQAISHVQNVLVQLCFGLSHYTKRELDQHIQMTIGAKNWRIGLWQFVKRLPPTSVSLSDWVAQTNGIFQNWIEEKSWPLSDENNITFEVKQEVGRHKNKEFLRWPVSTFFTEVSSEREHVRVETVHAAKGKTYEAVLFVVSDTRSKKGTAKQLWEKPDGDEEIRTAYVAMTRPRKLLVVAVPQDTKRKYLRRFPEWMKPELSGQLSFLH